METKKPKHGGGLTARNRNGLDRFRQVAAVGLLGRLWPPERVVLAARVCKWMLTELNDFVDEVLVHVRNDRDRTFPVVLARMLARYKQNSVSIVSACPCKTPTVADALRLATTRGFGPRLVSLDLAGCKLGRFGIWTLAQHLKMFKGLHCLDLSANGIDADITAFLVSGLTECKIARLRMRDNHIRNEGAQKLVESVKESLTCLDFAKCFLQVEGIRWLAEASLLSDLTLDQNNCGEDGHRNLAENINAEKLEKLSLRCCLSGKGANPISLMLRRATSLNALSLDSNAIGADTSHLASGLAHCTLLERLTLNHNVMEDRGVARIAESLRLCAALSHLELAGVGLTPEGATSLADSLASCKLLSRLELNDNRICDSGTQQLANLLNLSPKLGTIHLDRNLIGDEGARFLAASLRRRPLTQLSLCANDVADHGAALLLRAVDDGRVKRLLLRNNLKIANAEMISRIEEVN